MKRILLVAVPLLVVVMLAGWFLGRPAWRRYKESRSVDQAQQFYEKKDFRSASLSARQALMANPNNVDACRLMANLSELARSTNTLDWLQRVAQVEPTPENKLRLAAASLRFQRPPFPVASNVLSELGTSATNLPAFHLVLAERALKLNHPAEAVAAFETASRLEPENEGHQLNLAVLRLRSTNTTEAAQARATLETLRGHTNIGPVALRWLVAERIDNRDLPTAEQFSAQLVAGSGATLEDRFQHLAILQGKPGFQPFFEQTRQRAATNANEIYAVSAWMISRGMTNELTGWLDALPPEIQKTQPVPLARVDLFLARRNWVGLESFLSGEKWGNLEFLRWAFLSRTAAEQQQPQLSDLRWRSALREAGDRLGGLTSLLNMARTWGRQSASEDLLWQIAQRFPRERWVYRELVRLYEAAGDARGLNRVYTAMLAQEPRNLFTRNNYAATSLLTGQNLSRARALARDIYTEKPDDPVVASTYALSLYLEGKPAEALAAFAKVKPEQLKEPTLAFYYGLVLQANSDPRAAEYLALAKDTRLLPEERALLKAP